MDLTDKSALLRISVASGFKKGLSSFVWLLKILLPVSFLIKFIEACGWLELITSGFQPVMHLLHLPPMAALPIITGMLTGIYGGIAAMAMLPLTVAQMTLVAVFLLIAHNLVQEGLIQARSGISAIKATTVRLVTAVLTVIVVAQFLDTRSNLDAQTAVGMAAAVPFKTMLRDWLTATLHLCLKMGVIVTLVTVVMEVMKNFRLTERILKIMAPLLKLMGLDRKVGMLWLTGVLFGIAYGGAVIVQEADRGGFSKEDIEKLHLSIGVNHSVIEDPVLFMSFGLHPFWMWIPRLAAAVLIVYAADLSHRIKTSAMQRRTLKR